MTLNEINKGKIMHCYLFCVFELWKLIFSPDNKCVTLCIQKGTWRVHVSFLCFFFYKQLKKEFQCNNKNLTSCFDQTCSVLHFMLIKNSKVLLTQIKWIESSTLNENWIKEYPRTSSLLFFLFFLLYILLYFFCVKQILDLQDLKQTNGAIK